MNIIRYNYPQLIRRTSRDTSLRALFDSALPFTSPVLGKASWRPALDVFEDEEKVAVQVELPGLKREDFDISLQDDVLTISGERHSEKSGEGESYRRERTFGAFRRSVTLSSTIKADAVTATYEDGVLTVTLPKAEEAKPRKIQVDLN